MHQFKNVVTSLALLSVCLPAFASVQPDDLQTVQENTGKFELVGNESAANTTSADTSPISLPCGYRFKRFIWTKVHQSLFLGSNTATTARLPEPAVGSDLVSWQAHNPLLPFSGIYTARTLPTAEDSSSQKLKVAFYSFLRKYFPAASSGLPSIPDGNDRLTSLFPSEYTALLPLLPMPADLKRGQISNDVIGALALEGPLGAYIKHTPSATDNNLYKINLSDYYQFPVKEGLSRLGGIATLRYVPEQNSMETVSIEYEGQIYTKASGEEWKHKQKIMLMGMSTDTTVVRHLLHTHYIVAGTFCAVNNRYLLPNHPLRLLMYPHQYSTLSVNSMNTPLLMANAGSYVPVFFSYDRPTAVNLINQKIGSFNIENMDIERNTTNRGMTITGDAQEGTVNYKYGNNTISLWNIIKKHVGDYIDVYYTNDTAVSEDPQIRQWFNALQQYIPNGITHYAASPTKTNLQRLITTFIYTASVEHEIVGNIEVNYGIWHNLIPSQVPRDINKRPSIDIFHQYMDISFATSAPSIKLTDDFSYLALDDAGKQSFKDFRTALLAYQQALEARGDNTYTVFPLKLEAGTSA
ncbi:lipoxygenase family protein [Candidatus Finniella inopinata]|uniref:Lipoxygenase domain-containing protein n=1 Tax=Candidatus Finniella inopinata TaxID=1696036 RepID=A0A4Q7DHF1_9PROT|nr:lipoxygenase family protein [Candidatus Finniella inopinata]RZI46183.1 hypothetical protein EQU50_04405 [Candidatus Finniella inopinata]